MEFQVIIHTTEDAGYWAELPALLGCATQGENLDELMTNVREAIAGYLLAQETE